MTPAGTSNELDVQNGWEENTHTNTPHIIKGAVYTVWIFICICMSLRVFLFAKKMKFLTKGGIHCISQVFPSHFYFMREHSLVELTEHDDSAANIIVHSIIISAHKSDLSYPWSQTQASLSIV